MDGHLDVLRSARTSAQAPASRATTTGTSPRSSRSSTSASCSRGVGGASAATRLTTPASGGTSSSRTRRRPGRCAAAATRTRSFSGAGQEGVLAPGAVNRHEVKPFLDERFRQGYDTVAAVWVDESLQEKRFLRLGPLAAAPLYVRAVAYDWLRLAHGRRDLRLSPLGAAAAVPLVPLLRLVDLAGMVFALASGTAPCGRSRAEWTRSGRRSSSPRTGAGRPSRASSPRSGRRSRNTEAILVDSSGDSGAEDVRLAEPWLTVSCAAGASAAGPGAQPRGGDGARTPRRVPRRRCRPRAVVARRA